MVSSVKSLIYLVSKLAVVWQHRGLLGHKRYVVMKDLLHLFHVCNYHHSQFALKVGVI